MKIEISELKKMLCDFFLSAGFSEKDSATYAQLVIDQEMIGNRFSAVGELGGKHARLMEEAGEQAETVEVDKPSLMLIKGNGRPAPLITSDYLDKIISKAKSQGIYVFGIYDSTYNEFFDVFCRRIAAQDCIALIVENGGPQGVVPFGGRKDITGTNPLAYGIPTNTDPIIFDAATAEHAYGLIRLAKESGDSLPENAYVDKDGNLTKDPNVAHAVLPFGGYKGYAINLLVDVLSGALVRGKSGLDQPEDSQRYIGTLIIVLDPASFGDLGEFKNSTSKLVADILAVPAVDPAKPVRVPGMNGAKRIHRFEEAGEIEIDEKDWAKFQNTKKAAK